MESWPRWQKTWMLWSPWLYSRSTGGPEQGGWVSISHLGLGTLPHIPWGKFAKIESEEPNGKCHFGDSHI